MGDRDMTGRAVTTQPGLMRGCAGLRSIPPSRAPTGPC